jgi:hypothetical protein
MTLPASLHGLFPGGRSVGQPMRGVSGLLGNSFGAVSLTLETIATYLILVSVLGLGGAAIFWAARRYKRPPPEPWTPTEELERFRALQDQGELRPEEFERIRALLEQTPPETPQRAKPLAEPPDAFTAGDSPR